jgi:hypothetical protein
MIRLEDRLGGSRADLTFGHDQLFPFWKLLVPELGIEPSALGLELLAISSHGLTETTKATACDRGPCCPCGT